MKNANYETPISILLHLSFIQAVNFNTIFILLLNFLFEIKLNFIILFSPIVVLSFINIYSFYYKLNPQQRRELIDRKPRYKRLIYDIYDVTSTVLFILAMVLVSKYK